MGYYGILDFAKKTVQLLNSAKSSKEFAEIYINAKTYCFHNFQFGLITSNSHGINFFNNIINYWDDPDVYYKQDPKKITNPDYEQNFILILKKNKVIDSQYVI